jgi:undecaprenyl-diphosphatase
MNWDTLLIKDEEISNKIQGVLGKYKIVLSFLAHSADSWYWGAALGILWLVGSVTWRGIIQLLLLGIFATSLLVQGLKFIIKRPRPEGEWGQIYRSSDPHSFPSGHAARAIMLTTIMLLSGYVWIGVGMLVWTLLVDLSRVGLGVHYLSDIFVGTGIGIVMGVVVKLIF